MNIFGMADENSTNLKDQHDSLRKSYKERSNVSILDAFTKLISDKWTISINMDPAAVNGFLISGEYKNVHEVKKERAEELEESGRYSKSKISVEEALRRRLKRFYKSRIAFDRAFEDGERFKYGALNIGGLAANKYGKCCVVFKREQVNEYLSLALVKEDSTKYVDDDAVNVERLGQDVANRECLHLLAALKHKGDVESTPDNEWSSMVCCSEDYIEAITVDEMPIAHIDTVRISKKDNDLYYDKLYRDFYSELSASEKLELDAFRNMRKLLDKRGVEVEILNENGN